jgi:hypothetical protein
MKMDGSVALVTGANRGLGQVFARELVRRGAAKSRDPELIYPPVQKFWDDVIKSS